MPTRRHQRLTDQGLLERRIVAYLRSRPGGPTANQRQIATTLGELTSTVHYAVGRLVDRGYLQWLPSQGRSKPIALVPDRALAAGLAIDGGRLRLAVLNLVEDVVVECDHPQPQEPGLALPAFVARVGRMIDECLAEANLERAHLQGLAVALNGLVAEDGGTVLELGTFGWRDVALGPALAAALDCPVHLQETAAIAEATAEAVAGVGRGFESLLYYRIGDGISARLVRAGQLDRGAFGYGGELGHIPLAASAGQACALCGSERCLEVHAGGPALAAKFARLTGQPTPPASPPEVFAEMVAQAQQDRSPARELLAEALALWTDGLVVAMNAYDPPALALGGWCLRDHPALAERLIERLRGVLLDASRRPARMALAAVEPARRDLAAAGDALRLLVNLNDTLAGLA